MTTTTRFTTKTGAALTAALLATASAVPALAATTEEGVTLTILRAPEEPAVLAVPREAVAGERFEAGPSETVEVLFADGTSVVLAPGSALAVEAFAYDSEARTGELRLRLERGLARIAGGTLNNTSPIVVVTPSATVELDNATAFVEVGPEGATRASLVAGRRLTVTSGGETKVVERPGYEITVAAADQPPSGPVEQEPGAARADAEALRSGRAVVAFTVNGDVEETREETEQAALPEPEAGPEGETPDQGAEETPAGDTGPIGDTRDEVADTRDEVADTRDRVPDTQPGSDAPAVTPGAQIGAVSGSLGLGAGDTLTGTNPERSQGSDSQAPDRGLIQDRLPIRAANPSVDENEDVERTLGKTTTRFYFGLTGQPFTQDLADGDPADLREVAEANVAFGYANYEGIALAIVPPGEPFVEPEDPAGDLALPFGIDADWFGNLNDVPSSGIRAPVLLPLLEPDNGRVVFSSVKGLAGFRQEEPEGSEEDNAEEIARALGLPLELVGSEAAWIEVRDAIIAGDGAAANLDDLVNDGTITREQADRIINNLTLVRRGEFIESDETDPDVGSPFDVAEYRLLSAGFDKEMLDREPNNFFFLEGVPAKVTKRQVSDIQDSFDLDGDTIVFAEDPGEGGDPIVEFANEIDLSPRFEEGEDENAPAFLARVQNVARVILNANGIVRESELQDIDLNESEQAAVLARVNEPIVFEPNPDDEGTRFVFATGDVDELDLDPDDPDGRRELGLTVDKFFLTSGLTGFEEISDEPGTAAGIRAFLRNETALGLDNLADTGLLVVNRPAQGDTADEQRSPMLHADFGLAGVRGDQRSTISVTLGEVVRKKAEDIPVGGGFEYPYVLVDADGNPITDDSGDPVIVRDGELLREEGGKLVPQDSAGLPEGAQVEPLPGGAVYRVYEVGLAGGQTIASSRVPAEEGGGADRAATLITSPLAITASGGGNPELDAPGRPGYLVLENYDVACDDSGCTPRDGFDGGVERPLEALDGPEADERRYALLRLGTAVGSEVPERANRQITLEGYAAGLSEFQIQGAEDIGLAALGIGPDDGLIVLLDPTTNRARAELGVTGRYASGPLVLGGLGDDAAGRSAYVDGDTFAARSGGEEGVQAALVTGADLRDGLPEELRAPIKEDYEHLQWGFFFGDVAVPTVDGNRLREHVHLGTWAAGSPVDPSRLPTRGEATYVGHAIGNVFDGTALYTATGRYENRWNFSARSGVVDIRNFDGADYSGLTRLEDGKASFVGGLEGAGRRGDLRGRFVDNGTTPAGDPPGGVVGRFAVGGGGYNAAGTFGAERQD